MLDLAFGLTETYVYRLACGVCGEWVAWACPRANDRATPPSRSYQVSSRVPDHHLSRAGRHQAEAATSDEEHDGLDTSSIFSFFLHLTRLVSRCSSSPSLLFSFALHCAKLSVADSLSLSLSLSVCCVCVWCGVCVIVDGYKPPHH
jgi:hypothetical protein